MNSPVYRPKNCGIREIYRRVPTDGDARIAIGKGDAKKVARCSARFRSPCGSAIRCAQNCPIISDRNPERRIDQENIAQVLW